MSGPSDINPQTFYRYDRDRFTLIHAQSAAEYVLSIVINHEEFATVVCTPTELDQLVVGFLASEGVISSASQIAQLMIDRDTGYAYVELTTQAAVDPALYSKRRVSSCCGKSRMSFYFASDEYTVRPVHSDMTLSPTDILGYMKQLSDQSHIHRLTGGVHNAGLGQHGELFLIHTDIGRHNALDKIFGECLMQQLSTNNKVLVISGRISSEMVLKTAKIGCPILLSKSAPTSLALELADQLGITAVGFIREGQFNVYSHPNRVKGLLNR